MTELFQQKKQA